MRNGKRWVGLSLATGILLLGGASGAEPKLAWERAMGDKDANERAEAAVLVDDGVVAVGEWAPRTGGVSGWLVRTLTDGRVVFQRKLGAPKARLFGVAQTINKMLIYAGAFGDALKVVRLNIAGVEQSADTWAIPGAKVTRARVFSLPDNGFIVAGSASGTADGKAVFLVGRWDATGKRLWANSYPSPAKDSGSVAEAIVEVGRKITTLAMTIDDQSAVAVLVVDAKGEALETKVYKVKGKGIFNINALSHAPDAGLLLAGVAQVPTNDGGGDENAFVMRVNFEGKEMWRSTFAMPGAQAVNAVVEGQDEGVSYLVGTTQDAKGRTLHVIKVDPKGKKVWARTFPGTVAGLKHVHSVRFDARGLLVAGSTEAGGHDLWLALLEGID